MDAKGMMPKWLELDVHHITHLKGSFRPLLISILFIPLWA
jgi:hypothetical protein